MIKNWKKFNEDSNEEEFPDRRTEYGSYINPEGEEYFDDDDDDIRIRFLENTTTNGY